ncbi:hypothetical protein DY943_31250 [Pseudomonas aeruginosa]|nr:hypothetical protein [Pseudomonas aeruginosa]RTS42728.1 hypothetical protein DY943_31250 [Pseudomonas aeruginosa]
MTCAGCQRRREWIAKWTRVAYERARGVITGAAASGDEADQRSSGSTDQEQRSVDRGSSSE